MQNNILDIFYNHIVKEASTGRINCLSYYNIIFSTNIIETNEFIKSDISDDDIYIPTLFIKNKKEFDEYLIKYVTAALEFYDDSNFEQEILNYKMYEDTKKICKEKVILTLLWSNATPEDFNNPVEYLKKRIDFIKNSRETEEQIGYSETLKGEITVKIKKDKIYNETPYMMAITITGDDNQTYDLPLLKFGIQNNKLYIYAVQNKNSEENDYTKKVKRILYKVNENFDKTNDNYEIYEDGNLSDITTSFLLTSNIGIFFLQRNNINEIIIPSILLERWNAKKVATNIRSRKKDNKEEFIKEQEQIQTNIQTNITQKLIRTFLRLQHHHESLSTTNYPMEIDTSLHMSLIDEKIKCNNKLLEETALISKENNKKK